MPVWERGRASGSATATWISLNTVSMWFTWSSKVAVSEATFFKKPFHVSSPACRLLILCVMAACSMRIDVASASSQKWSNFLCCSWRSSACDSPAGTLSSRDCWNNKHTMKPYFIPTLLTETINFIILQISTSKHTELLKYNSLWTTLNGTQHINPTTFQLSCNWLNLACLWVYFHVLILQTSPFLAIPSHTKFYSVTALLVN